jgi:hypothetical protein
MLGDLFIKKIICCTHRMSIKMPLAVATTAVKLGLGLNPETVQLKKQDPDKGTLLQGDAIESAETLYQKVEDLALEAALMPPTPLMISFSLLTYEECDAAFDAMVSTFLVLCVQNFFFTKCIII